MCCSVILLYAVGISPAPTTSVTFSGQTYKGFSCVQSWMEAALLLQCSTLTNADPSRDPELNHVRSARGHGSGRIVPVTKNIQELCSSVPNPNLWLRGEHSSMELAVLAQPWAAQADRLLQHWPALQSSALQQGISLAAAPVISRKARAPQGADVLLVHKYRNTGFF